MLKIVGKPSDYKLNHFMNTLGSYEAEQVMNNIMTMLAYAENKRDEYRPFTWKDYKKFCSHKVTENELLVMELLVTGGNYHDNIGGTSTIPGGMLVKTGKTYKITLRFLDRIKSYRK